MKIKMKILIFFIALFVFVENAFCEDWLDINSPEAQKIYRQLKKEQAAAKKVKPTDKEKFEILKKERAKADEEKRRALINAQKEKDDAVAETTEGAEGEDRLLVDRVEYERPGDPFYSDSAGSTIRKETASAPIPPVNKKEIGKSVATPPSSNINEKTTVAGKKPFVGVPGISTEQKVYLLKKEVDKLRNEVSGLKNRTGILEDRFDLSSNGKIKAELIFFKFGSSELTNEGRVFLDEIAKRAIANLITNIKISGHASPGGSRTKNIEIAKNRALSIHEYLSGVGVKSLIVSSEETSRFGDGKNGSIIWEVVESASTQ